MTDQDTRDTNASSAKDGDAANPESKSPLTPEMRHKLRGPLNQIIGYSQMLQEEARDHGQVAFLPDLGKIETAARALFQMLESIANATPLPEEPEEPEQPVLSPESIVQEGLSYRSSPPAAPDAQAVAAAAAAARGRILLVDDSEGNRTLLSTALSRRHYDVTTAAGGKECIEKVQRDSFDLILLDIMMPDIGGLKVLEKLRATHSASDLPVIMVTARDASEDVVKALALGANDYVTKPTDISVVAARVANQLSLKKARDEVKQLNRRLADGNDRIARLLDSSSQAMLDFEAWTRATAAEVAAVINAREIAVWVVESDQLKKLTGEFNPPVTFDAIRAAIQDRSRALVTMGVAPVVGLSGEVLGALVVSRDNVVWGDIECRLVQGMARQFGGALEHIRMRKELAEANVRRRSTRQDMLARGIDVLHVCSECGRCYDQTEEYCPLDNALLDAPRLLPYRLYGIYRFVRMLRTSGQALIFRAFDQKYKRDVAVKIIKPEHFAGHGSRAAFQREMRVVGQVDHPGVGAIYDMGELDEGSLFIVTEWLHGMDLEDVLSSMGKGTPSQVASLLRKSASALSAVHRAGLIHGNIKPSNLFLLPKNDGFDVKVVDFRAARQSVSWKAFLSQTGMIGSPAYMAPEQMRGEPMDARSDVFALATVGLEALLGRPIRDDHGLVQVFMDALFRPPTRPSSVLQGVPREIDEAFLRALAKSPADRPMDVANWVGTFAELLDKLPTQEPGWRLPPTQRASVWDIDVPSM
jgi:DNA-binding response OmpR family regulator